jgi:hypothetical protein
MTGPLEANPYALPLEQIDVSNPWLYQQDLIGPYFERLRHEAPVHYCANGAYGAFWSITRYDDIVAVNANDEVFSCDYQLGGHVLGYEKMFRANGVDARMFQSTDAPIHTAQRKAIAPVVARASVREMEDMIRARCGVTATASSELYKARLSYFYHQTRIFWSVFLHTPLSFCMSRLFTPAPCSYLLLPPTPFLISFPPPAPLTFFSFLLPSPTLLVSLNTNKLLLQCW